MGKEIAAAALGFRFLLFIIKPAPDGMMGIVNLHNEIGKGELQLMRPQPAADIARRKAEPRAEKQENVRGLPDESASRFQKRRRKRRARNLGAVEEFHHRRHTAA